MINFKEAVSYVDSIKYFFETGKSEIFTDTVTTEHELTIIISESETINLNCTPDDLESLIIGKLYTDGIISSISDVVSLNFSDDISAVNIVFCNEHKRRIFAPPTEDEIKLALDKSPDMISIRAIVKYFGEGSALFHRTGAMHSCVISVNGNVKYAAYDIGRFNAIDKAIGMALANNEDFSQCILFTSGRAPLETVKKALYAGIPVLISRSAPTDKGVAFAKLNGIKLLGFADEIRINIYT